MNLLSSGIFWFIGGILFCFMLASFRAWTIERGIRMAPWKWALVVAWILLAGFTAAFIGTSLGEEEKSATLFTGS
ncbi:MAG TPA: hypothetical protein VLA34_10915, partial [Candidatus Krumholzibacterium sp.]|nr:hypothetical protein [Candidatus Krumholzibacterium sp.]